MAGVKISALPGVGSALITDFFPVVQAGVTSQETLSQVSTLFQTIMLPLAGGTMSGAINMGTFQINNMGDPTLAQDAATKNYVDNFATGGGSPAVAASTTALTVTYANGVSGVGATLTNAGAQAVFSLDGQSPNVGQRVLIKDQASTFQNGVYTVTNVGSVASNWILTRANDYDTPVSINDTGVIPVIAGTVNANTGWINTTTMVTVGTTAVTFVQFGVSFPVSLANGGTGANLTASNGGIFYSTASTGAILSGTSTAGQLLLSGSSASPSWSTSTYPATNAINTLLYASAANTMAALATANNGALVTDSSGVPSISSTLPSAVISNIPGRLLNVQVFTTPGTNSYTKTSGTNNALVKVQGAGGGGGGSGSASGSAGGTGGTSSVGAVVSATGGNGGSTPPNTSGGTGGAGAGGTYNLTGGRGNTADGNLTSILSGAGGCSVFGGAGVGGILSSAGLDAQTNTGAGGGGGGGNGSTVHGAGGGGAGGYAELWWTSVSNQTVTVGAGGTAGSAGTSGFAGGAGGSGIVIIYEYS